VERGSNGQSLDQLLQRLIVQQVRGVGGVSERRRSAMETLTELHGEKERGEKGRRKGRSG
jgi:hypothetical protein